MLQILDPYFIVLIHYLLRSNDLSSLGQFIEIASKILYTVFFFYERIAKRSHNIVISFK